MIPLLCPLVCQECKRDGSRVSETCGLEHDVVIRSACLLTTATELSQRRQDILAQRAAYASIVNGHQVFFGAELVGYCTQSRTSISEQPCQDQSLDAQNWPSSDFRPDKLSYTNIQSLYGVYHWLAVACNRTNTYAAT